MQRIIPYLSYDDAAAAAAWLARAFGFVETLRYTGPDGTVSHSELALAGEAVFISSGGSGGHSVVHVTVDDVEAHYAAALGAGARIVSGLEDTPYGVRRYRARDLDGHVWIFAQRLRDVAPEVWGAVALGGGN